MTTTTPADKMGQLSRVGLAIVALIAMLMVAAVVTGVHVIDAVVQKSVAPRRAFHPPKPMSDVPVSHQRARFLAGQTSRPHIRAPGRVGENMAAHHHNLGPNPAGGWELPPHALAILADYVRDPEGNTGHDDLFDDGLYHTSRVTFHGHGHPMMPHGQTFYRPAVEHLTQGLPPGVEDAHGAYGHDRVPRPTTAGAPFRRNAAAARSYRFRDPVM